MRPPQPAHPDAHVTLKTYLPGWLKNRVIHAAETDGSSLNAWLITAILTQLNHEVPAPHPAAPLPDVTTTIRSYLTGETLLGPCGQPWDTCDAQQDRIQTAAGDSWCSTCGIRCT